MIQCRRSFSDVIKQFDWAHFLIAPPRSGRIQAQTPCSSHLMVFAFLKMPPSCEHIMAKTKQYTHTLTLTSPLLLRLQETSELTSVCGKRDQVSVQEEDTKQGIGGLVLSEAGARPANQSCVVLNLASHTTRES